MYQLSAATVTAGAKLQMERSCSSPPQWSHSLSMQSSPRLSVSGLGKAAHHQPADVKDRETEASLVARDGLRWLHDAFQPQHPEEDAGVEGQTERDTDILESQSELATCKQLWISDVLWIHLVSVPHLDIAIKYESIHASCMSNFIKLSYRGKILLLSVLKQQSHTNVNNQLHIIQYCISTVGQELFVCVETKHNQWIFQWNMEYKDFLHKYIIHVFFTAFSLDHIKDHFFYWDSHEPESMITMRAGMKLCSLCGCSETWGVWMKWQREATVFLCFLYLSFLCRSLLICTMTIRNQRKHADSSNLWSLTHSNQTCTLSVGLWLSSCLLFSVLFCLTAGCPLCC